MYSEPLNPTLYERLERYYGQGQVEIVAAGEDIHWTEEWTAVEDSDEKVPTRRVLSSGEEYKVRCKVCRDHRARLQINHRWGVHDPFTDSRNLWLAQCWNENCYDNYDNQKWLFEAVFALGTGPVNMKLNPGKPAMARGLSEVKPPGTMYRLDVLAQKMPGHYALEYLSSRGFDPVKLGRLWQVAYCSSSRFHHASDRIIIPIHMNGMLAGWQARYIGDDVEGVSFNKAGVPKYFSCPGMMRRMLAYNLERALKHPTVVIVEGPADCWNTGLMAVGCIGKTLSPYIRQKVIDGMKRHGDDGVVVIALDPKQDPRDLAKNKPHHIENLRNQLRADLGNRIVPVYLDEQYDPGSIDREYFRDIIRKEASKRKLKVSFAKPSNNSNHAA